MKLQWAGSKKWAGGMSTDRGSAVTEGYTVTIDVSGSPLTIAAQIVDALQRCGEQFVVKSVVLHVERPVRGARVRSQSLPRPEGSV